MDARDFEALAALIHQRGGFDIRPYKEDYLHRRLRARLRRLRLPGLTAYLRYLQETPAEMAALIGTLTVHVSQLFRNPEVFTRLQQEVLPELLRTVHWSPLRLWSLGCAGGEEPVTLALLLAEAEVAAERVRILATDVSAQVLDRAREGVFGAEALATVPRPYRRWFVADGGHWRLDAAVQRRLRFRRQDLLDPRPYPRADLILCRNVLIYFDRERQRQVLDRLADALPAGGYLVLGRAETLPLEVRDRFDARFPAERIYQKRTPERPSVAAADSDRGEGDPHAS
jgi:chemotaxis protein methyltransferase CheR